MAKFPFIGASYTLPSVQADCQRSLNLYPEVVESGEGKNKVILKRTPGLSLFATLGVGTGLTGDSGPVRAIWAGEQRLFAVAGAFTSGGNVYSSVYEIYADGTSIDNPGGASGAGLVVNDGNPAQILSNGNQLLVISGGFIYCNNGSGFAGVSSPVADPVTFFSASGTCNTDATGSVVTWVSGSTDPAGVTQDFSVLGANDAGPGTIPSPGAMMVVRASSSSGTAYQTHTFLVPYFNSSTQVLLASAAQANLTGAIWQVFGVNTEATSFQGSGGGTAGTLFMPYLSAWLSPLNLPGTVVLVANPASPGTAIAYTVDSTQVYADELALTAVVGGSGFTGNFSNPAYAMYPNGMPVTASMGTMMDDYFIVASPSSRNFYLSQPLNGSLWDAADVFSKERYPDNISSIKADHELLWITGDESSTEIWQDTGNANTPFQPVASGGLVHYGSAAPFSFVRFDNGVAWLALDQERGGPVALYAQGLQPVRISNHAVEKAWESYVTINASAFSGVVGYSYIEGGHHFLVYIFPAANACWVYDSTASAEAQMPLWHERGWWNGTSTQAPLQWFHAYAALGGPNASNAATTPMAPRHFAGDGVTTANGLVYLQSEAYLDDNGTLIERIRTAPHLAQENYRTFHSRFELMAQVKQGSGSGQINPSMDYSVDYGQTFVNARTRTSVQSGLTDQYQARLIWWRNGASRDRVYRITIKDKADFALVDAYYEAESGTS